MELEVVLVVDPVAALVVALGLELGLVVLALGLVALALVALALVALALGPARHRHRPDPLPTQLSPGIQQTSF